VTIPVTAAQPGLFSADSSGRGLGAILNQDGSYNSAQNPAGKGTILQLFGTGEGQTTPPGITGLLASPPIPRPVGSVSATVGGVPVTNIAYAGSVSGLVTGLLQVNITIPSNAPSGNVPVVISIGSAPSQSGLTAVIR
jgi:uncharacterized protein (TIGR03437 family)